MRPTQHYKNHWRFIPPSRPVRTRWQSDFKNVLSNIYGYKVIGACEKKKSPRQIKETELELLLNGRYNYEFCYPNIWNQIGKNMYRYPWGYYFVLLDVNNIIHKIYCVM